MYDAIDEAMAGWLEAQPLFFVATAPLAADGHVNVSPKGMAGTFRVLGPACVAYLDYSGSGAETIAHLRENGRVVLMFCSFDRKPLIVRLHGRGRVVLAADPSCASPSPTWTSPASGTPSTAPTPAARTATSRRTGATATP